MDSSTLRAGIVIPASPLALTASRRLDERRQRALYRYYSAAGAGGIAVGVHTTQFAIRDPRIGLFEPVLALAADEMDRLDSVRTDVDGMNRQGAHPLVRIAGVCGDTAQAVREAATARDLGYHAGLLSLAALSGRDDPALLSHCRAVGEIIPLVGFYLQPAAGGRRLEYAFWREFAKIPEVIAIKIAPFNRYSTIDVMRAVAESGRDDIALYTGNDDNIIMDLVTPYRFAGAGGLVERRIVGGLLGHWSVWTARAVEHLELCHVAIRSRHPSEAEPNYAELLRLGIAITDSNAAFFDAANGFRGSIAGLHEVLRRQGLFEGIWQLDETEGLGDVQLKEIDRVYAAYPTLNDDDFVAAHRDNWLSG